MQDKNVIEKLSQPYKSLISTKEMLKQYINKFNEKFQKREILNSINALYSFTGFERHFTFQPDSPAVISFTRIDIEKKKLTHIQLELVKPIEQLTTNYKVILRYNVYPKYPKERENINTFWIGLRAPYTIYVQRKQTETANTKFMKESIRVYYTNIKNLFSEISISYTIKIED